MKEWRNISIRTKQALAAAKARGVRLGNLAQAKANKRDADRYAKTLKPLARAPPLSVEAIAAKLTKRKAVVCTKNLIRVDDAMESPKLAG